jgi:hypothetical protein
MDVATKEERIAMNERRPTSGQNPANAQAQPAGKMNLDHGVHSLVAQDSPDDSQLGAPKNPGKKGSAPGE